MNNPDDFYIFSDDENILQIIVSRNSKYILSRSDSKNSYVSPLKLWDILNKKLVRELHIDKKYDPLPHSMSFTPDGNKIIIGLWNYLIIIFDFQSGNIQETVKLNVRPHIFSPDGKMFLSIGEKLDLWETMTGNHVRTLWVAD